MENISIQIPLGYTPEKGEQGVSLCGSVARHVAAFLGRRIPQGENPRLLQDYYSQNYGYIGECTIQNIPSHAYILDIFLTSNTKLGKIYGHRVIAEKIGMTWFVHDPYFKVPDSSLEKYIESYRSVRGDILKIHAYF